MQNRMFGIKLMRIKSLETFLFLAKTNCDFNSHKTLGVPRSNMWNHINEIESETGLKLIERQKGNSFLTKQGLDFVSVAQEMCLSYNEGIGKIRHEQSIQAEGNIIIATTAAIASSWLLQSIKDFHLRYPQLIVNVVANDFLDKTTESGADILLRPIGQNPDYDRKWYIQYRHNLYASKAYLKDKGTPQEADDLLNHCLMGYGIHPFSHFEEIDWHFKGKTWGLPKLSPTLTINSTTSLFFASIQGIGICSTTNYSN